MGGAAITISILTLAAANTLGVSVDLGMAIILCLISAISACGASGVAGGSLLLIPLACSLFGISNDLALNSSTDVLFTAAADIGARRKNK